MQLNFWPTTDTSTQDYLRDKAKSLENLAVSLGIDPNKLEISFSRKVANEEKQARKSNRQYTRVLSGGYYYMGDTLCIDLDDIMLGEILKSLYQTTSFSIPDIGRADCNNMIMEASKIMAYVAMQNVDWDKYNIRKYGEYAEAFMHLFVNSMYRMESASIREFVMVIPDPYTIFDEYLAAPESKMETILLRLFDSVCYHICVNDCSFAAYAEQAYKKNRLMGRLDTIIAELERAYRRNNGQFM